MFSFLPNLFWTNNNKAPEDAMADYVMYQDKKALEALYQKFANDIYHFLLTLSDENLAQDIAQKTWLKVIENPHSYNRLGSVKAWLFTIARNMLIDEFRKTNRLVNLGHSNETIESQQQFDTNNSASISSASDIDDAFNQALMTLNFEQREAFCLQQEGFSLHDIAHMTDCKQETIKTRIRYAKSKLKTELAILVERLNDKV